ncbi:MAG: alcohol dehydrogenase catalytic domain-containing protein [Chloroflexi bacterium]|nr:alcohol dehydrogenase catalytic domain-containing protein [Chloroflexota bacterium]
MKALAVHLRTRKVNLIETPEPAVTSPTEVRVKVQQVGLCDTDYNILRGQEVKAPPNATSLILGHEMVGRVVERGPGVRQLRLGDTVVATVRRSCGVCESCNHGESDRCYSGLYRERGIWKAHGYMAEYTVDDEASLVQVPRETAEVAVLAEPLSIAGKALEEARRIQRQIRARCIHPEHAWDQAGWASCKRVLVAGAGTLGFLTGILLAVSGATAYVYSTQPSGSPVARLLAEAGAVYLSAEQAPVRELPNWVNEVDVVIEATGDPGMPPALVPIMARNAVMVLLGTPLGRSRAPGEGAALWRALAEANCTILGCTASNRRHLQGAVGALSLLNQRFPELLARFITHRLPLEEARSALSSAIPEAMKTVVEV